MSNTTPSIVTLPNPRLRQVSKPVGKITASVNTLIKQMKVATLTWEAGREHEVGVALAAVQIDEHHRAIIVRDNFEDKANTNFTAYLNPKITSRSGKPVVDYEGCLSVKDIYGLVPRYPNIKLTALNDKGQEITEEIEGFRARVIQHEIDHLDGKLFIDHIKKYDVFFRLNDEGDLEKLDHDAVLASDILW